MNTKVLSSGGSAPTLAPWVVWTGLVGLAALVGATVVRAPWIAISLVALVVFGAWIVERRVLVWWDLFLLALAGPVLLDYGWANLGIRAGSLPIPVTEILLGILLCVVFVIGPRPRLGIAISALLVLFVWASIRLLIDYRQFGIESIRDFALYWEMGYLFLGYWAIRRFGVRRFVRGLSIIFAVAFIYLAFFPIRDQLVELSPVVGLQHPTPLIGSYWGAGIVAGSGFFFAPLLRPYGHFSYAVAAFMLALLLLVQARGMYLAVPIALLSLVLARPAESRSHVRRLLAALAWSIAAMLIVFSVAPQGRVGQLTPTFLFRHLSTVAGEEGPSAGTLFDRAEWRRSTFEAMAEKPFGWLLGVGLGPDLIGGFRDPQGQLVRKPHNDYLEVLARLGPLGLGLLLVLLLQSLRSVVAVVRMNSVSSDLANLAQWILATVIIYLLIAATQPLLAFPHGTVPLFSMLGVGLGIHQQVRHQPDEPWG